MRRRPTIANDGEENSSVGVEKVNTIFETLAHPVLRSVDPKTGALFVCERKRYIQEVTERRKENPRMEVASLRVSVDYCLLENMHVMGRFDSIAPEVGAEELSEDHIKAFLESIN